MVADGQLTFDDNLVLSSLHGLEGLTQVGENLRGLGSIALVPGTPVITRNESLQSRAGLDNFGR